MVFDTSLLHELPNGQEIELDLECTYDVGHDGIGPYEFWGQKCFDKGQPTMDFEPASQCRLLRAGFVGSDGYLPEAKVQTLGFQKLVERIILLNEEELVERAWEDASQDNSPD